jgi:tRNA threonylcarbamoyladenosine biosynthesis protein TsaE
MGYQISVVSHSPDEMADWGRKLGALLETGDVVALVGELGAGKTTLAQGIARGMGVPEDSYIASPTFTLINEYRGRFPLYHLDVYRIDDPSDCAILGLEEYLCGAGVALVEWADKIATLLPNDHLVVRLAYLDETVRRALVCATGDRSEALLRSLEKMLPGREGP